MQTFVPYGSEFEANAYVLDVRRLGKQRVEGYQILRTLKTWRSNPDRKVGWVNHPAVVMWRFHDAALLSYTLEMCERWSLLGYKDNVANLLRQEFPQSAEFVATYPDAVALPPWLDDDRVMMSHRSNLIRKFPEHYKEFWPTIDGDMPYFWPVKKEVSL
jgi:hypothetical protein